MDNRKIMIGVDSTVVVRTPHRAQEFARARISLGVSAPWQYFCSLPPRNGLSLDRETIGSRGANSGTDTLRRLDCRKVCQGTAHGSERHRTRDSLEQPVRLVRPKPLLWPRRKATPASRPVHL